MVFINNNIFCKYNCYGFCFRSHVCQDHWILFATWLSHLRHNISFSRLFFLLFNFSWLLFSFTFVSSRLPRVLSSFFSSVWQSSLPSDSASILLSTVCYGFWSQLTVCHGFCSPSHCLSWLLFSFSMFVISFFIALFYLYCTSHSFCSSSHKLPWLLCSSIPHYLFFA